MVATETCFRRTILRESSELLAKPIDPLAGVEVKFLVDVSDDLWFESAIRVRRDVRGEAALSGRCPDQPMLRNVQ